MDLAQRIQAKTDNGDTIIDFLIEVMKAERDDFKICHRLDAARLLRKYGWDEATDFIADNPSDPSRSCSGSTSSDDSEFDRVLAKKIQEATDDGTTVCRFLINVMEGQLKTFKPHHRIAAARELLDRGFGKHARQEAATYVAVANPSRTPDSKSQKSLNQINQSSDNQDDGWAAFWEEVTPLLEEDDRIKAELAEHDPDSQPYERDLSAYNEAWENSEKWFYEWKNSLDPEEYEAIASREIAEFNAMIDTKIERRKQIKAAGEQREKEEAEREAQRAEAEAEAAAEEPEEPGPPTRSQHKQKLLFTLGNSMYVDCEHPDCDLHDEDRNRWQGSVQYGAGPTTGHFP